VSSSDAPCRLFVYLARDAPVGVVLRRGPSDWVRLSRWITSDDTFEHGQWMRNRAYERRSDLSPDGSLFVAFVRGSGQDAGPNRDSWVAVSRPPWFTALALWFVGGTYCTGGFFPDAGTLWLGFKPGQPDKGDLPPWLSATTSTEGYIDRTNDWPDRTVWLNRLRRDGWELIVGAVPETWRRPHQDGTLLLEMTIVSNLAFDAYGGRYVVEYAVVTADHRELFPLGQATWADWDRRGRLVIARDGRLLHWTPPDRYKLIEDFNPQVPDPAAAPPDASVWPEPPSD
jgi:hypothetical protein